MIESIEISNLSKRYKGASKDSIKALSFKIKAQDKLSITGPNGAGKTTLISIITQSLSASNGSVKFYDASGEVKHKKVLHKIGIVPQNLALYEDLSPRENLYYFGALFNLPKDVLFERTDFLLKELDLAKVANDKVSTFSGGMKRKVNLAIGLIHDPEIIFLDEPTVGIDVHSKTAIIEYINKLNQEGKTIIYTSHYLEEAEKLCNRIIMLTDGKIVANGSIDGLLEEFQQQNLEGLYYHFNQKNGADV